MDTFASSTEIVIAFKLWDKINVLNAFFYETFLSKVYSKWIKRKLKLLNTSMIFRFYQVLSRVIFEGIKTIFHAIYLWINFIKITKKSNRLIICSSNMFKLIIFIIKISELIKQYQNNRWNQRKPTYSQNIWEVRMMIVKEQSLLRYYLIMNTCLLKIKELILKIYLENYKS